MKNIFLIRSAKSFCELTQTFLEALEENGNDVCVWKQNLQKANEDDTTRIAFVQSWMQSLDTPLKKTKYAKAVQNILNQAPCVYHAIAYRDSSAVNEANVDMGALMNHNTLSQEDSAIVWQYIDELNELAHKVFKREPVRVPTNSEISSNIEQRRRRNAVATNNNLVTPSTEPVLRTGIVEIWQELCKLRNVTDKVDEEHVLNTFQTLADKVVVDRTVSDLCSARQTAGQERIVCELPCLGNDPFDEEHWQLVNKAFALATMHNSIPAPMMQGIEKMAHELVNDMNDGKMSFAGLNMESIGQRVLAGVSTDDMNVFANNLEKILPAMRNASN